MSLAFKRTVYPSVLGGIEYYFGRTELGWNIGEMGQAQVNIEGLGAVTFDVHQVPSNSLTARVTVQTAATATDIVIVGERALVDALTVTFSGPIVTPVTVVVTARERHS